ncbi:ABC transporter permease [Chitinophaga sp. 212800010-3]|uniref:ABC transporter permease n=1 Tax=unclassified Chitinophaga TaxID=2619133 RepID=UPI002DF615E7|nr:Duplicated orphan permease [Chitinophaga sp. 212800010-3]
MLSNYFKTAWRSLRHHKLFSALNILGLTLGMSSAILIFLWVQDELSYDRFNADAEDIYRVIVRGAGKEAATAPFAFGPALQEELPEVLAAARFTPADQKVLSYRDRQFSETGIGYADSNFLQVFNYPLVKGSPQEALSRKDGILLTERAAAKYFGNDDPLGKMMMLDNQGSFMVTGVLKNIPRNSHLQFDFLLPMSVREEKERNDNSFWNNFTYFTFLKLRKNAADAPGKIQQLQQKVLAVYKKHTPQVEATFELQPLTDIHLRSHYIMDVAGQGNIQYVHIFSWVALIILVIGCINFMNLATAISGARAKEVGLRKTIGAQRYQLALQFLAESLLLCFTALVLSLVLVWLILPVFNDITGKEVNLLFLSGSRIAWLLAITVVVGLLAGGYPALVLSSFKPVNVLKGMKTFHPGKSYFRNGLVVLQFTISIVLIIGTIVVNQQLQFIHHRDIGYNKENLLYIPIPQMGDMQKSARLIDETLSRYPGITDHTIVSDLPTNLTSGDVDVHWAGQQPGRQVVFSLLGGDEHLISAFGMHLIAGRYFSKDFAGDEHNYLVNETALKTMGLTPTAALGKTITYSGHVGTIIGVLRDFNFKPIHQPVDPLLLMKDWSRGNLYVVVRTTPATLKAILPLVQKSFGSVYQGYPFTYGFVDQDLSRLYVAEQHMGRLINVFSLLSILVSCLGLFGLSAYTAQRRFKEIGVRKVLGASVAGIVRLLAGEFLLPVAIAGLIAFPLAAWVMTRWLAAFAYRIPLHWWFFLVAGTGALIIALITISFQAIKAALVNPVQSLRSE